ncbi:MAG TPA: BamA/TamA family outer membrane protein [Candidatus Krumholzibacteria bacterium]
MRCAAVSMAAIAIAVAPSSATQPSRSPGSRTVTVRASDDYDRGTAWRWVLGKDWRDVWSAEVTVPVLDLGRYAGGLTPYKSGGNQSRTLRFKGGDGRIYMFRSTEKRIKQTMKVPGNSLVQDQTACFHPTGHLVAAALQEAVGLLHTTPELVYLPDDPRLGKYREKFANTLGQIELRPDEYDNGTVFAGAKKICDTETLIDNLEESSANRLDSREYLTARLVDFLVGDTDRGSDQWLFAKFERGDGAVYRPIVKDRDYAFLKLEGIVSVVGGLFDPRVSQFGAEYPSLKTLCFTTREFDRSHLVDMDWRAWQAVVHDMQRRLDDATIERAARRMPEGHYATSGAEIVAGLRQRRDALPSMAREFYLLVNREADVFGSDDPERVAIDRDADGSVMVRMWRMPQNRNADAVPAASSRATRAASAEPVFERRFVPGETREIRVYLERGNDRAILRGNAPKTILVRVMGGEGDDALEDSSRAGRGIVTRFHDASGENTFVRGTGTSISTRPFSAVPPIHWEEDGKKKEQTRQIHEERRGRMRDLMKRSDSLLDPESGERFAGESGAWVPVTGYRESAGVVLGIGPSKSEFAFRHQPYKWRASVQGLVGTSTGEMGVQFEADHRFENSRWSLAVSGHATNLELNRFYGYGNDTPLIDEDLTMIERFEVLVRPSFRREFGHASALEFGPVLRYVDPQLPAGGPVTDAPPPGSEPFGQAGLRADLTLDIARFEKREQKGFQFDLGGSAYPAMWDATDDFGEAHAIARAYIPLGWPTLALRAGGQRCWGVFPLHESAFIGGRWTLRGFRWNRFAGDASAYGTAELRVPVAEISDGQLGVIGFGDAGRVWMGDESEGGWHSGLGAGLWYGSGSRQASVAWAKGDEHRVYFWWGMPF